MPEEIRCVLKETTKNLSDMNDIEDVLDNPELVNQKAAEKNDDVTISKSAAWHWNHKPYGV